MRGEMQKGKKGNKFLWSELETLPKTRIFFAGQVRPTQWGPSAVARQTKGPALRLEQARG